MLQPFLPVPFQALRAMFVERNPVGALARTFRTAAINRRSVGDDVGDELVSRRKAVGVCLEVSQLGGDAFRCIFGHLSLSLFA